MFNWIRKSIKNKIIVMIVIVIAIAGTIISLFSYFSTISSLSYQKEDNLKEATVSEAYGMHNSFEQSLILAKSMSINSDVISYFSKKASLETMNNFLDAQIINDVINNVSIIDLEGTVIASSDDVIVQTKYNDKDFFERALSGEQSITYVVDFDTKKVEYYAFSPVKSSDGKVLGVIAIQVNQSPIYSSLKSTTLHDIEDIMLVDGDGLVLYSTEEEDILKSLWNLFDSEKKDIEDKHKSTDIEIKSMQYEDAKNKVKNYTGPQVFKFKCMGDDEEEIMSLSSIGNLPLYLVTEFEKEELEEIAMEKAIIQFVFGIGLTIAVIIVISMFLTKLLKPLKALKIIIESISRGNLDQDIDIKTKDEFRELGDAIGEMLEKLKKKK